MKVLMKVLRAITEVFNYISIAALLFMLCLSFLNVVMRYIFNSPITGTFELTRMGMICLTPSIAVTILSGKTIWVDILTSHFSRRGQMVVDILTLPASVVICGLIAWRSYLQIFVTMENQTIYTSIGLYEWPFRVVFFIAMCAATLAAFVYTVERLGKYRNNGVPHDTNEVEEAIQKAGMLTEDREEDRP